MKMYVICDNRDTHTGMRLAGIEGVIVNDAAQFHTELEKAVANKDIAVLLINEKLCEYDQELVDRIKLKYKQPLIVEIPDRHGAGRSENFITSYVRDAIGVSF